ncbi:MAG: translation elongation factor Ts [Bacteroidales bacterium]|nr:translation elongation factor Ts [Bacteroidales bacterium]MCF8344082.1 translation elongation factor Ts [Bacteroidales bacterium]MCF8351742.1 translation elongation factor Ts [Bacteroidales bacterium]MCF8376657.1 translation elongation factor Ts [Bacteroidales bacterium]MCF8402049.1 translation elongation factor Ts [Bacteroidales bacterium]
MANITAAEVNKLRKQTGAGMMDCKKALQEADGDFEKAVEVLRKKGQKVAAKRADREATEGFVIGKTNETHDFGVAVLLSCETDFVAKSEGFVSFVNKVADAALFKKVKSLDELKETDLDGRKLDEQVTDLMGKIGEKIELADYQIIEAPHVSAYNHMGNKLATLVGLNKAEGEDLDTTGKELAMQVAAMNPVAVDEGDVDQKIIDKEKEIGMEQARQEGKPEQILEKIAMGKVNKFLKENTLLNQDFVRDTKKSVKQYLSEKDKDLTVSAFRRVSLV